MNIKSKIIISGIAVLTAMSIIDNDKLMWSKWMLSFKHHNCRNHAELIDSYTSQVDSQSGNASWTTTSYKCKICGKCWDID